MEYIFLSFPYNCRSIKFEVKIIYTKMSLKAGQHIRNVGCVEWFYNVAICRHLFGSVSESCRYSNPISKERLIYALRCIIMDQPWLLANMFYKSPEVGCNEASWALIEELDLNSVVDYRYTTETVEDDPKSPLTSKAASTMLNRGKPENDNRTDAVQWRIIVYNDIEVCLVFDHGIFDGITAYMFHELLLKYLRQQESLNVDYSLQKITIGVKDIPVPTDRDATSLFPPHPDRVIKYSPSKLFLINNVIGQYLPRFFWPHSLKRLWTIPGAIPNVSEYKVIPKTPDLPPVQSEIINLTEQETDKILKACKKHNVTVTAFLTTLTAECVSHYFDLNPSNKTPTPIRFTILANTRKCISPSNPNLNGIEPSRLWGFHATGVSGTYHDDNNSTTLGEKIIAFGSELRELVQPKNLLTKSLNALIEFIPSSFNFFTYWLRDPTFNLIYWSNLGYHKFEYNPNSKYNIERMTLAAGVPGVGFMVEAATTNYKDSPVMTLTFTASSMFLRGVRNQPPKKDISEFVKEMRELLKIADEVMDKKTSIEYDSSEINDIDSKMGSDGELTT